MGRRKDPTKPCGYRGRLIGDITRQLDAASALAGVVDALLYDEGAIPVLNERSVEILRNNLNRYRDACGHNGLEPDGD